MDTSTLSPTPTSPPERCPACGAAPTDDNSDHRFFACGSAWSKNIHQFYSGCQNALTVMPEMLAACRSALAAVAPALNIPLATMSTEHLFQINERIVQSALLLIAAIARFERRQP